ncbi:MAG: FoF1 ATP synthase subunit a [Patescibacteria group bacterium]
MNFLQIKHGIPGIEPEFLFNIFGYPIASSTFFIFFILILFIVAAYFCVKKLQLVPGGFQTVIEIIYEAIADFLISIVGKDRAEFVIPIVGSLFVYVGVSNLIGIIPGLTSFTFKGIEIFRVPTTDFNTTVGLAIGSVIFLQVVSIMDFGILGHFGKFFKFKEVYFGFRKGVGAGVMSIIDLFVGLLEFVGEFTRIISLSFRLFGNMYAHEVLAIIIMGALAYVLPAVWSTMGLLVGVVQALVFGSLIAVYYSLSVKSADGHGH